MSIRKKYLIYVLILVGLGAFYLIGLLRSGLSAKSWGLLVLGALVGAFYVYLTKIYKNQMGEKSLKLFKVMISISVILSLLSLFFKQLRVTDWPDLFAPFLVAFGLVFFTYAFFWIIKASEEELVARESSAEVQFVKKAYRPLLYLAIPILVIVAILAIVSLLWDFISFIR